jgi:hypothetical protein
LVPWLAARHHKASTGKYWRRGVFLRHPIDAYRSEALLSLTRDDELALEVRAPSPDLYFNVLRDSIEDLITTRWPGLTYQLFVPCPGEHRTRRRVPDVSASTDCCGYASTVKRASIRALTAARSTRSRRSSPGSPIRADLSPPRLSKSTTS